MHLRKQSTKSTKRKSDMLDR